MFDSREYEFSDITVIAGGLDIEGIRGVKIMEKQEKESIYGKGKKPRSIQRGNISYEIELTMLQSSYEAIANSSPTGSILDLQLDVTCQFGNPENGDAILTKFIRGWQATEASTEMKTGDKFAEITVPGIALDVKGEAVP